MSILRPRAPRLAAVVAALLLAAAAPSQAQKVTGFVNRGDAGFGGVLAAVVSLPRIAVTIECDDSAAKAEVPIPFLEAIPYWQELNETEWESISGLSPSFLRFPSLSADPLAYTDANLKEVINTITGDAAFQADLLPQAGTQSIRNSVYAGYEPGTLPARRTVLELPLLNPTTIKDLILVPRPSDYGEEPIATLDARTFLFQVGVPTGRFEKELLSGYETGYLDPGTIQVRGWYIQGRGGDDGKRPIFMMLHNYEAKVLTASDATAIAWRKIAFEAASKGFDVILYSWRARDVSEGRNPKDGDEGAYDIFRILEAFEAGCPTLLAGESQTVDRQLLSDAETRPVVLFGFGDGSNQVAKAMTLNFAPSFNSEANTPRHFNFRGAVLVWTDGGSLYYRSSMSPFAILNHSLMRLLYFSNYETESSVLEHAGLWPGVLLIQGTDDANYTLAGAVALYNRARGEKKIRAVIGPGPEPILASDQLPVTISESLKFARHVLKKEPRFGNLKTTTVAKEVCKALDREEEEFEE